MPSLAQKWMSALSVTDDALHVSSVFNQKSTSANCVHASLHPFFQFLGSVHHFFQVKVSHITINKLGFFCDQKKKKKKKETHSYRRWSETIPQKPPKSWLECFHYIFKRANNNKCLFYKMLLEAKSSIKFKKYRCVPGCFAHTCVPQSKILRMADI